MGTTGSFFIPRSSTTETEDSNTDNGMFIDDNYSRLNLSYYQQVGRYIHLDDELGDLFGASTQNPEESNNCSTINATPAVEIGESHLNEYEVLENSGQDQSYVMPPLSCAFGSIASSFSKIITFNKHGDEMERREIENPNGEIEFTPQRRSTLKTNQIFGN